VSDLDTTAIARGAGTAAAVALPAAVVQNLVSEGSSLRSLLFLVIAAGFGLGGWVAGRARPARAMTHGGVAAVLGYAGVLVVSIVVRLARGAGVALAGIPLPALIALSCGVIGGYVAYRQAETGSQAEVSP
jgi:hypothetical protein